MSNRPPYHRSEYTPEESSIAWLVSRWTFFPLILILLTFIPQEKFGTHPHPSILISVFYLLMCLFTGRMVWPNFYAFSSHRYQHTLIFKSFWTTALSLPLLVLIGVLADEIGTRVFPLEFSPLFAIMIVATFSISLYWYKLGIKIYTLNKKYYEERFQPTKPFENL